MSAKSYLITIDGNAEIQSAKERLFNLAPDFVHSIEKDAVRIAALEAQLEEAKKVISPFAENYKAFLRTNDASNIRKGWFTELQQAYEYMNKVTQ